MSGDMRSGDGTTARTAAPHAADLLGQPGVPLRRTIHVELRKLVDTRSGLWIVLLMGASSIAALGLSAVWGADGGAGLAALLSAAALPLTLLLPILGSLTATAEWTQRTGLTTFAIEPRRGRVVVAKTGAAIVLTVVILMTALVAAFLVNAAVVQGPWDVSPAEGLGKAGVLLIYVLQGVAFGFLLLNTSAAVVAVLLLPTVWSIAVGAISSLKWAGTWLDLGAVTAPLTAGQMTTDAWAHLAVAVLLWVLLPLAVGTRRVLAKDIT